MEGLIFGNQAKLVLLSIMFERIKKFFEESRTEFRHINWPTRDEAIHLTAVVIGLSLALALFLGLFDYAFTNLIKYMIFNL